MCFFVLERSVALFSPGHGEQVSVFPSATLSLCCVASRVCDAIVDIVFIVQSARRLQ